MTRLSILPSVLVALCLSAAAQAAPGRVFYVSPVGDDSWSGSIPQPAPDGTDGPLASLHAARDAVRELKAAEGLPDGGVHVVLRGGTYRLSRPFDLEEEDSGRAGAPIVYKAADGETVVLSGGAVLQGFSPVEDRKILRRLRREARAHVVHTNLRDQGVDDLGSLTGGYRRSNQNVLQLFFDDRRMEMARWPNEGFARITNAIDSRRWRYENDRPDHWADEPEVWLHGFFYYDWFDTRTTVQSIDTEAKIINVGRVHPKGIKEGQWYYAFNVLAELSRPGEWYLDVENAVLYFWPPEPADRGAATISMLRHLVVAEGASHVTLKRLILHASSG